MTRVTCKMVECIHRDPSSSECKREGILLTGATAPVCLSHKLTQQTPTDVKGDGVTTCPECGEELRNTEGCRNCPNCLWSKCG